MEVLDTVPPIVWFLRRHMRKHRGNLSLPQFRSLVRVDKQPGANVTAVAEHLGCSLPTTSRILSGLVQRGLLARQGSSTDRRRVGLSITPRGRAVLQKARAETHLNVETALTSLTDSNRATVVKAMHVLKSIFGPLGHGISLGGKQTPPTATPSPSRTRKPRAMATS